MLRPEIWVPTRGFVFHETAAALQQLREDAIHQYDLYIPAVQYAQGNASVADVRNRIVRDFLGLGDSEVLIMVDDDVVPAPNLLDLLDPIDSGEAAIVGAVVPIVRPGTVHMPSVYRWNKEEQEYEIPREYFMGQGVQRVDAVGTGAIAIHRSVLQGMDAPFEARYDKRGILNMGEDLNFCRRARRDGHKIAVHFGVFCEHFHHLHGNALAHAYLNLFNESFEARDREEADA
jgi:GT2 family glycosyltransferase